VHRYPEGRPQRRVRDSHGLAGSLSREGGLKYPEISDDRSVALLANPPSEFSKADYADAAKAYVATHGRFGSPKDAASYDHWMIAELAAGRVRPSAIAIRRYFGTWEAVISAVIPLDDEEVGGIVDMFKVESATDECWARVGELVDEILASMPWNSFLSIQYGDGTGQRSQPYAQATPGPEGVWCEIVSEEFLPPNAWPIHPNVLSEDGWYPPNAQVPNWYRPGVPLAAAGHFILEGLRLGRSCGDAEQLQWHTGNFPSGSTLTAGSRWMTSWAGLFRPSRMPAEQ